MAEPGEFQRLQPALLDRLTDNAPDKAEESRNERIIDENRLRNIVQRDLSWLLNTRNYETLIKDDGFPHVKRSVVNFGVRGIAGEIATSDRADEIRKTIHEAIIRFEPRIDPKTLEVTTRVSEEGSQAVISYDIRADLWAQPLPLELYLRSEVNIATGELKLNQGRR